MPRIDVPFDVRGQIITQPTNAEIASGICEYLYAIFNVCDTWDKVSAEKAVFIRGDDSYIQELYDVDNHLECKVPWEVVMRPGFFRVGIVGGDRLTTNLADVKVIQGSIDDSIDPILPSPTPGWFGTHNHDDRYYTKEEINKMSSIGGGIIGTDETLLLKNGILSVNTTNKVENDNTLPITSAAVAVTVGNIEVLLNTI